MLAEQGQQGLANLTGGALDTVFTEIKRRIGEQLTEVSGLNGRASTGLTSGSILAALTGLHAVVQTIHPPQDLTTLIQVLTIASLVIYIVVVIAAIIAYWIRGFDTGPDPDELVTQHAIAHQPCVGQPPLALADQIKRGIADKLIDGFNTNHHARAMPCGPLPYFVCIM